MAKKKVTAVIKLQVAKHMDPSLSEEIDEVIQMLVDADEILAATAIEDAKDAAEGLTGSQRDRVDHHIAMAEWQMYRAQLWLDMGKPANAIDAYRLAWTHAQLALKFAGC